MRKSNSIPFVKRVTAIFQWGNSDHQSYYFALKSRFSRAHANFIRAVRLFRGRDEVDAMVQICAPDTPLKDSQGVVLTPKNFDGIKTLDMSDDDHTYTQSFDFENFPSPLKEEWNEISRQLVSVMEREFENVLTSSSEKLKALNKASQNIKSFRLRNHSLITSDIQGFFDTSEYSVEINKMIYRSISLAVRRTIKAKHGSDKVKALNIYFDYCYSVLIPYIYEKRIHLHTLSFIADFLNSISSEEALEAARCYREENKDKKRFEYEISKLEDLAIVLRKFVSYFNEIIQRSDEFSGDIPESKTDFIPCELEGEIVYLSPDSAEGKAIKRLEDIDIGNEVHWITDVEEDTFTNEADLDRWLSASGYL